MPTRTATARRRNTNDPDEADFRADDPGTPAFLRPETNEPDARDEPLPEWTRPPADWREEHDLAAGHTQLRGLSPPGAAGPDNPCALRLKLPGPRAAARPAEPGTAHEDRAYVKGPFVFTPRDGGGWTVALRNSNHRVGTIAETSGGVEIRRADQWSTLLAIVPRTGPEALLEPPLLGRTLGLAHLVFSFRWPAGPPRVRLPDDYRKTRKPTLERGTATR